MSISYPYKKVHSARPLRAPCALAALIFALVLAVSSVMPIHSSAQTPSPYPERTASLVWDDTGVLTDATVTHIGEVNRKLFALTGAEVAVVVAASTGTEEIGDYGRGLFAEWGIGSAELDNGVLLLVSAAKRDFWAIQGRGITDVLSPNKLKSLLNEHMLVSFDAGDTDAGALRTFDAVVAYLENVYRVDLDEFDEAAAPAFTDADRGGEPSDAGVAPDRRSLTDTVFGTVRAVFYTLLIGAAALGAVLFIRSLLLSRAERERMERPPLPLSDTQTVRTEEVRRAAANRASTGKGIAPAKNIAPANLSNTAKNNPSVNKNAPAGRPAPLNASAPVNRPVQSPKTVQPGRPAQSPTPAQTADRPRRKNTIDGIDNDADEL